MIKETLKKRIAQAARKAHETGVLPSSEFPPVELEAPKNETHGDFSSNIAMTSASAQKMAPRKIAEAILAHIDDPDGIIEKSEIAGPGFINFFLRPSAWWPVLPVIHDNAEEYGRSNFGGGAKAQVEFVSANPTGPLHVGHGRGAAVGDAVASVLAFCGFDVQREYYINDSGRQIRTLGFSVFLRYKEACGISVDFPADCYQGDYIRELAGELYSAEKRALLDREEDQAILHCAKYAADSILAGIRDDLEAFGVRFDRWYSEQSLYNSGKVDETIETFRNSGVIYEKEGALWFRTSDHGDEKDRVVVRSNGQTTYFASDIAYHQDKYHRGMSRIIDVWGADHHGYINRMKAAVTACGNDPDSFEVILVQLVNLLRGGEPVAMSSRAGEFVTLKEVVDEVGRDAARFIFLTRHYDSKLDFDLEVAKRQSNDNPVYYVQYVHARISSIIEKAAERGVEMTPPADDLLKRLDNTGDIGLIKVLHRFPEVVETSGRLLEPHRITYYLTDLASAFHAYYNKHKVLTDDAELTKARLCLVNGVQRVIRNGLNLLGVSSPDKM